MKETRRANVMMAIILCLGVAVLVTPLFAYWVEQEPGFLSTPKLTIDHVENETKIYVHAIGDYRYQNITIRVDWKNQTGNWENTTENYTDTCGMIYSIHNSTELVLNITIYDRNDNPNRYNYNASIIVGTSPDPILTITEHIIENGITKNREPIKVKENELPYITIMEMKT